MGNTRSTTVRDWDHHRAEMEAEIENYEIGIKPPRPDSVTATYSNGMLTVNVSVGTNTIKLSSRVILPAGSGPFPAIIGMNSPSGSVNRSLLTNVAKITFSHDQVTRYGRAPSASDPYYTLYPELLGNSGQYSAWAWGVSRLIDGLELVQNQLPIDLKHIGVTGCSYAGKMALFSGALDQRVALTIAQESGGGGDTSWRYSATEPPCAASKDWPRLTTNGFGQACSNLGIPTVSLSAGRSPYVMRAGGAPAPCLRPGIPITPGSPILPLTSVTGPRRRFMTRWA